MFLLCDAVTAASVLLPAISEEAAPAERASEELAQGAGSSTAAKGIDLTQLKCTSKSESQWEAGNYHGFPRIVDNYVNLARVSPLVGDDGVTRTLAQIPGGYKNGEGVFEYTIEPDGVTCNHRVFLEKP